MVSYFATSASERNTAQPASHGTRHTMIATHGRDMANFRKTQADRRRLSAASSLRSIRGPARKGVIDGLEPPGLPHSGRNGGFRPRFPFFPLSSCGLGTRPRFATGVSPPHWLEPRTRERQRPASLLHRLEDQAGNRCPRAGLLQSNIRATKVRDATPFEGVTDNQHQSPRPCHG